MDPIASSSSAPVTLFDGKREHYEDFKYSCKAILYEHNVGDVVLQPQQFAANVQAAVIAGNQQLHRDYVQMSNTAFRIIMSRCSPRVKEEFCRLTPDTNHFNPLTLWVFLQQQYGMSESARAIANNPYKAVLPVLRIRCDNKDRASVFVRTVVSKVKLAATDGRIATQIALLTGLAAQHILEELVSIPRYQAVSQPLMVLLATDQGLPDFTFLDHILSQVEQLDAIFPVKPAGASKFPGGGKKGDGGRVQQAAGGRPQHSPKVVDKRGGGGGHGGKVHSVSGGGGGGSDSTSVNFDCYLSPLASSSPPAPKPPTTKRQAIFLVDSGATHHCVREQSLFTEFRPGKHVVRVANGKSITGTGMGNVTVLVPAKDGQLVQVTMRDVFLVPSLANNIFSTNRFKSEHHVTLGPGTECALRIATHEIPLINEHGLVWLVASRLEKKKAASVNTSPAVPQTPAAQPVPSSAAAAPPAPQSPAVQSVPPPPPPSSTTSPPAAATSATSSTTGSAVPKPGTKQETISLQLFHERMGHVNFKDCKSLAAELGIKLTHTDVSVCDVCQICKQRKEPIPDLASRKAVKPGEVLHCDIKGPLDSAYNRAKYALVVVDEATRVCAVKPMQTKDQIVDALKFIITQFARFHGKRIDVKENAILHSDSEAVLKSKGMSEFLASRGITARASPPYTHERNGIVERAIQTLFNSVRVLLTQAKMDNKFWPIALQHAAYLHNRAPTQALGGRTPMQVLTGSCPSLSKLRTFGCKVFVKVDDSARRALDNKAREGIYVGHSDLSDSFRILVQTGNGRWDVVDSVHCKFDEASSVPAAAPVPAATAPTSAPTSAAQPAAQAPLLADRDPLLDDFDDAPPIISALFMDSDGITPTSYRAAMSSNESASWGSAIKSEIDSLHSNGTFEVVPQSEANGHKVLSSNWIFTKKDGAEPGSVRYKARLVARGDHQREGLDYNEVYSPVVNANTVRAFMAVAAEMDYELDQMDAVTAFLNAPLEEELFLRVPDGYPAVPAGSVLRLKKSLYGLKQAPRYWNKTLHDWLLSYGLQQSLIDPCLYFIPGKLWVAFWVDDFLVMASSVSEKDAFKSAISKQFKMHDLGAVNQFLGMTITRDRSLRVLGLQSTKHIDAMLERFGMLDAKPFKTPLPHKVILVPCAEDGSDRLPQGVPFRALVGSLLYVAMWTRPDIAFAVSQVARFQQNPSNNHWMYAKHILRYLKGTRTLGLSYAATGTPLVLRGFVDASYAEDLSTRRSQTGYVFTLGNAAVSWKSQLQSCVAQSSTEAEYLALAAATKEALFLRNLLGDLSTTAAGAPVTLFEDNQSTIKQASNLQSSARTKHIDVRHHFIKDHVARGDVVLEYLPTESQPADALTKNLDRVKVSSFRQSMLGDVSPESMV